MNIKIIYEKYKHLDCLLSDREYLGIDNTKTTNRAYLNIMYEAWQAIKADISKDANEKDHTNIATAIEELAEKHAGKGNIK